LARLVAISRCLLKIDSRKEQSEVSHKIKLWLPVPEAARMIGISRDGAYRDIRRGTFPFRTKVISGRIHMSARDIELIPETTANEETQEGGQSVATAAPTYA
jgi:hypothetical protein